jgi:hypothetical protein
VAGEPAASESRPVVITVRAEGGDERLTEHPAVRPVVGLTADGVHPMLNGETIRLDDAMRMRTRRPLG